MASPSMNPPDEPVDIGVARAQQFLKRLASNSFLAVIVSDDNVYVYTREFSPEDMERVREALGE